MKKTLVVIMVVVGVIFASFFFISRNNRSETPLEVCNVTILGVTYDVTNFREQHEGGDIFECGTDMTKQFTQQHGEDLQRLQRYLNKAQ